LPHASDVPLGDAPTVLPRVVVLGSADPQEVGLMAVRGSSATPTSTLLADLPQSVSVGTHRRGAGTARQPHQHGGLALRVGRGLPHRSVGGQGIVPSLLIRGLPALYAMSGMGTIREALPMDNAFIERIEVPKGPAPSSAVCPALAGAAAW
jgi:outer membrane receptor protein involved in Fe transport